MLLDEALIWGYSTHVWNAVHVLTLSSSLIMSRYALLIKGCRQDPEKHPTVTVQAMLGP